MTRILHIADLHFGREHQPLVDAFVERCETDPPDLVVATGDFTQGARRREFASARTFFDALNVPVVGAPGNHDVPSRALDHRFFTPWQRFDRVLGGRVEPRIDTHGLHVETLHTARRAQMQLDWSLGSVSRKDADALASTLDTSKDKLRVVACHHPLVAPGGLTGRAKTRRGSDAADAVAPVSDLVLTGHLHRTFALPVQGSSHVCWFVGASTTFSERTRDEPAGYNEIRVDDDWLTLIHYESVEAKAFAPGRAFRLARQPAPGLPAPLAVDPDSLDQ